LRLIEAAGQAMPALGGAAPRAGADDAAPSTGKGLHGAISILLVMTVLTVAPSLLVLTTSFTRIVIVLSLLRQAIGTQSLPPSQVIVGLALFMTFLVMGPTFERINAEALAPLRAGNIEADEAWARARQPMRDFMFEQLHHASNWQDLYLMLQFRGVDVSEPEKLSRDDVDTLALIPAYILSELKVSFLMGFKLYLPFLVIDMVVSSVLISMGMLMLPPVLISLPFKLLLFVLVDGWRLVAGNLLGSFAVEGVKLAGSG
jgi:flagellar biosynthetic protein FliP